MMTDREALSIFIEGALSKNKRNRYLGFISGMKGHVKFLRDLDHSVGKHILESRIVAELTQQQWYESGYLFTSKGIFGEHTETLMAAYESAPLDGGWLLISQSGSFGVLRPEGGIDNEIYVQV